MTAAYNFAAPTAVSITSVRSLHDYATDSDTPQSVVNLITIAADHAAAVEVLTEFAATQGVTQPASDGFGGYYLIGADGERNNYRGANAWEDGLRDALGAAGYTVAMSISPVA